MRQQTAACRLKPRQGRCQRPRPARSRRVGGAASSRARQPADRAAWAGHQPCASDVAAQHAPRPEYCPVPDSECSFCSSSWEMRARSLFARQRGQGDFIQGNHRPPVTTRRRRVLGTCIPAMARRQPAGQGARPRIAWRKVRAGTRATTTAPQLAWAVCGHSFSCLCAVVRRAHAHPSRAGRVAYSRRLTPHRRR